MSGANAARRCKDHPKSDCTRTHLRATTRFHYTRDVDTVLTPHLGRYRLADLDAQLLRTVFAAIADHWRGEPSDRKSEGAGLRALQPTYVTKAMSCGNRRVAALRFSLSGPGESHFVGLW